MSASMPALKEIDDTTMENNNSIPCFRHSIEQALQHYFSDMDGHMPTDLYQLVISEVERPLLQSVLNFTGGNQSKAAEVLGINRGTLRKKLKEHGFI